MDASYFAHSILGVVIDASSYSRREKAFDHEHPRHWNVDPVSGEKLWAVRPGHETLREMDFGEGPRITVMECGQDTDDVAIGLDLCRCHSTGQDMDSQSSLSLEEMLREREAIRARLRQAGVEFEDGDLGIHVIVTPVMNG